MKKTISAPGSIFFFGEHSVVYERPAIVAAIDLRTTVRIVKTSGDRICVNSHGYGVIDERVEEILKREYPDHTFYQDLMDPIRDLISTFYRQNNLSSGLELEIESDLGRGTGGLSTSTSCLCAVLQTLNLLHGEKIKLEEFFDWLYPFQVKIHGGKASGAEIISSSLGGYNRVLINKQVIPPKLERKSLGKKEFFIVIGDSQIERQTKETVSYVASGWEKAKEDYEEIFDRIGELVLEGEKAILEDNVELLGKLMLENHEILARELGVSHPKLNKLVDVAKRAGAYGAKLSGAGKGGIMIALCERENQKEVAKALQEAGARTFITRLGSEGVKVEE